MTTSPACSYSSSLLLSPVNTIVSPIFEGLSLLQRQRAVLAVVKEEIKSGELHALSVKTFTPAER